MNGKSVFSGITDDAGAEQMAIGLGDSQTQIMDVTKIIPNGLQPRRSYDEEKLELLAESIKQDGVLQPIIVKRRGESYLIVAGERRWRAACKAGLRMMPVIIRDDDDDTSADEVTALENMQREDLNTVDEIYMIKEFFDRGKDVKRIMVLTSRSRRYLYAAKRIAVFFQRAMAGNFATYDSLVVICRKFGIGTLEQAARLWETTDDLQAAMDVLEKGTSSAVRETAEIAVAEVEEQAGAPVEAPAARDTAAEEAFKTSVGQDNEAEEKIEATGQAQDRPFDPFAHDPMDETAQASVTPEPNDVGAGEIEGKSATKHTQNAEVPLPWEEEKAFGGSAGEAEKPSDTGTFSDASGAGRQPHVAPFEGGDNPKPESHESGHGDKKASGKRLLKIFTDLKEALEAAADITDAVLKIRENHRETLAELVRDVEFLSPSLPAAISAVEAHLSLSAKRS